MSTSQIKKKILQFVNNSDYSPMSPEALEKALSTPETHKKKFKRALKHLVEDEKLIIKNRQIVLKNVSTHEVKGNFFLHSRGFGFVQPHEGSSIMENVFIPRDYILDAITDDVVLIEISGGKSPKGYEGKVLKILKRNTKMLIGTVSHINKNDLELFCPVLGKKKSVIMKKGSQKVEVGDRLEVKVLSWGSNTKPIQTSFSKNLGSIEDASLDIKIAIKEYGIFEAFNKNCKEEAEKWGTRVKKENLKGRIDYTNLTTVTIDPDTAKDFDDALSLEIDKKGHFHLGVHIADVSHYIDIDSALDQEAFKRGNSTYFPGKCIPMIPESLSNGLCSLKPEVIRLSASVMIEFDSNGNQVDYLIQKAFIKSDKRFTYKEALKVLENRKKSPYAPLLNNLKKLALLLKKKRTDRGSIDFALPEGFIHIDKKGNPKHIERIEYDITHQLVEEFMLKANEVVATHLHHQIGRAIFRVHEEPDRENFSALFELTSRLGFSLPKRPEIKDIQSIFTQAKDSPFLPLLSIQFIRSLKLAMYSPDNVGHFGLALENYCHFTSPIRRYTDLVIHRLLFCKQYDGALEKTSMNCSETERKSMRAESSVILLKKLRLLELNRKSNPTKVYSAVVTKVFPMRVIFEVEEFFIEGSCHVSELSGDFYEFQNEALYGSRSGKRFAFGDKIEVKIKEVDLIFLQASWSIK
jgi:ribonuclease R